MPDIDWSKAPLGSGELVQKKQLDLDVFDPEIDTSKALTFINRHREKIEQLYDAADKLKVKDDLTLAHCSQLGGTVQGGIKEFRAVGNKILKPFKDVVSSISAAIKDNTDRLEAAKALLSSKSDMYLAAKLLRARQEAERKRQEALERQAKLAKEAEELGVDAPQIAIPSLTPAKSSVVRTSTGSSYQREETVVEVTDESLLPREYLQPNMPMIRKAAEGGTDIPGVTVKKVKKTVFKAAKS